MCQEQGRTLLICFSHQTTLVQYSSSKNTPVYIRFEIKHFDNERLTFFKRFNFQLVDFLKC